MRLFGQEVKHTVITIDAFNIWKIFVLRSPSHVYFCCPFKWCLIDEYQEFWGAIFSVEWLPSCRNCRWWSISYQSTISGVFGDIKDWSTWIPIVECNRFIVAPIATDRHRALSLLACDDTRVVLTPHTIYPCWCYSIRRAVQFLLAIIGALLFTKFKFKFKR